ncbi:MAG: hypothetical protein KA436_03665 [Oligoflexales bacterium]|nr:hypothetical protein [Oligoflexales bacterium]
MKIVTRTILSLLCIGSSQCGEKNYAECKPSKDGLTQEKTSTCSPRTPDEEAVLALNAGNYDKAQSILEPLIAQNPEEYMRYPRLASAYAGQAHFDLLSFGRNGGTQSSGQSLLDTLGQFVPSADKDHLDDYKVLVSKMEKAKNILLIMPLEYRSKNGIASYGASSETQLIMYQAAYSLMFMNQFIVPSAQEQGKIDPQVLETMTQEDALVILDNLKGASATAASNNPDLAKNIDEIEAKIKTTGGEDERKKLIDYLKNQKKS